MRLYPEDQVAAFLLHGWWSGKTWLDLLAEHVAAQPNRVSLVDPANREEITDGPARRLTWAEVDTEVRALARSLHGGGVRQGDVVGVQLPNVVELAIAYLATASLGAIACAFPIQYAGHELSQMGKLAGLRTFVTVGRANRARLATQAVGLFERVLAWGDDLPAGVVNLGQDSGDGDAEYRHYVGSIEIHPNDCVTLCWTSGTEGFPKGVPRAHGDWQAIALGTISTPKLTGEDVLLNPFPMVNAGGMAGMFLPWLMLGARLVQHHPFDLDVFLGQLERERVTYTCAPPAVLTNLVAHPDELAARDLSALRAVGSGSAPLPAWMIESWERDRGVEVLNLFGSNEGLCLFGCPDTIPDPADRGHLFPRPGDQSFSWRARAGRETRSRLVDPETGADIDEPGRPGELRVSAPTIFAGYWGDVPSPFDEQGYYRTGDIFEITGPGNHLLKYVDRAKDLISRGGYKVSAVEIESLLSAHTKVGEVALVGMPDPVLGERLCAFVAPRTPGDEPTLDELIGLLRDAQVARFKWPERLEIVAELPRNPIGKILKRALRATDGTDAVNPQLRQVVLLTGDLPGALVRTKSGLGLTDGMRDVEGMATLGFEHEVLRIDETFLEIVAPLAADSGPGRLLRRGGERGYMVAVRVADAAAVVERAATIGLKPVMNTVYEGNPLTQWHPRDLGTLAEIDEMRSGADWHFSQATGSTGVVADIVAAELAVPDPAEYARRWATLLDIPGGTTTLDLDGRELRFVPRAEGRDGLVAVELRGSTSNSARIDHALCGVRFSIGPA